MDGWMTFTPNSMQRRGRERGGKREMEVREECGVRMAVCVKDGF